MAAQPNTQIANITQQIQQNRQKSKPIEQLIQKSLSELGKAVPAHLNAERLVRIALTSLRRNPELAECTPESFLGALFQSAQLGLEPDVEGQAYLIPFNNSKKIGDQWTKVKEVQFQIGYKGFIELFYRHKLAKSIDVHTVFEKDLFEFNYGTDASLKHCPKFTPNEDGKINRGKPIGYYAIAKLNNDGNVFKFMNIDECMEHGTNHSKTYDKVKKEFSKTSPWVTERDAMCKKTVLKQLAKLLPKSIELQKALAMDSTTKSRVSLDMFEVKDETNWTDDNIGSEKEIKNE